MVMTAQPACATRVVSLDGCADQYALGLLPGEDIAALSDRAALDESYYRDRAKSFRRLRPQVESVLALRPDVVLRTWGGDAKLIAALQRNHITIININDVNTYPQAKDELMRVGHLLGADGQAQAEARAMEASLDGIDHIGVGKSVRYYTPSGYSAGPDTSVGYMLQTLGFTLESSEKGFFYLPPEVLLGETPDVFALGYYDDRYQSVRAPGRNALVRRRIAERPHLTLPSQIITCFAWYTAYDLEALSRKGLN